MRAFVIAALFVAATAAQSLDAHAQTGRRRRTPPRRPVAARPKPTPAPKPSAAAVTTA
jgi:hypothetical protein